MNNDIRQSIAATAPRVDDAWFDAGGFQTYKHPTPISYETATDNGTVQTLEGPVDYTAVAALKEIGIKYHEPAPRSTPIPWFNKHVNTSNKQTALQESESTNYVIGVMSDQLDYDALPEL